MRFSPEFIQKIKNSIILSNFLRKYLKLTSSGAGRFKALCPFHNEKTPSFVVNDESNSYHCFGCGAHGDVISFLVEKEGYNFSEAVKLLSDQLGFALPKEEMDPKKAIERNSDFEIFNKVTEFFKNNLAKDDKAKSYLRKRGLLKKTVEEFQFGYAGSQNEMNEFCRSQNISLEKLIQLGLYKKSDYGKAYFLFHDRLIIPIKNISGQIIAFGGRVLDDSLPKYLNSPEHKYFKKRELLFNLERARTDIRKSKKVIVSEGYMDVIALDSYGFKNAVAPLGTAFSEIHLQILWQYSENPIICLDGDEAGKKAMIRIAEIALPNLQPGKTLSFVILPENKDPDDILKEKGKDFFNKLLQNPVKLSEIILSDVTSKRDLSTPEERAKINSILQEKAGLIKDRLVKRQYLQYFNEASFNFFRQNRFFSNKKKTNHIPELNETFNIAEIDLLFFACINPEILEQDEIEEVFSQMQFSSDNLTDIQSLILEKKSDLDYSLVKKILDKKKNLELKELFTKKLKLQNNLTELDEEQKLEQWQYLQKLYHLAHLKSDYEALWTGDEDKQKLAIELSHDIKRLQIEVDNFFSS